MEDFYDTPDDAYLAMKYHKDSIEDWLKSKDYLKVFKNSSITEDSYVYKHPAYATLAFFNSRGGARDLFGSSIQHNDFITMEIKEAYNTRDLCNDWVFNRRLILEAQMSRTQFAEAISNIGNGVGTPITLTFREGRGRVPSCKVESKRKQFAQEFSDKISKQTESVNELIKRCEEVFFKKKTLNKSDKEEILRLLRNINQFTKGNSSFFAEQWNEQVDKTITEAKGDIEAFWDNKMRSLLSHELSEQIENGFEVPALFEPREE